MVTSRSNENKKVLFIQSSLEKSFGLMYISPMLKKEGVKCEVSICQGNMHILKSIKKANPFLIGFSFMTSEYKTVLNKIRFIKKHFDIPIIVGGIHPTLYPEIIYEDGVDFVCTGEGGNPLVELVKRLNRKEDVSKIGNLWVKKGKKVYKNEIEYVEENLNKLPFPDRELYNQVFFSRLDPAETVMLGRGCPYSCSYCFNAYFRKIYGKEAYIKQRASKNVIAELLSLKEKYHPLRINIIDECPFHDWNWTKKFLSEYAQKIKVPFLVNTPFIELNEKLIALLKDSKCISVRCGLETYNENVRKSLLNKQLTNKKIISAARILKKYKIRLMTYNLCGVNLADKKMEVKNILKFNKKIKADLVRIIPIKLYKSLPISMVFARKGFILEGYEYFPLKNKKEFATKIHFFLHWLKCNIYFLNPHIMSLPWSLTRLITMSYHMRLLLPYYGIRWCDIPAYLNRVLTKVKRV